MGHDNGGRPALLRRLEAGSGSPPPLCTRDSVSALDGIAFLLYIWPDGRVIQRLEDLRQQGGYRYRTLLIAAEHVHSLAGYLAHDAWRQLPAEATYRREIPVPDAGLSTIEGGGKRVHTDGVASLPGIVQNVSREIFAIERAIGMTPIVWADDNPTGRGLPSRPPGDDEPGWRARLRFIMRGK
jgi:hypothetical protein